MTAILTPAERSSFKACRRAWDLGARGRRNLEPAATGRPLDEDRLLRDALAVYYFPGMWDWSRAIVLPLVTQALTKAVAHERDHLGSQLPPDFEERAANMAQLLAAYLEWAPSVERLAPVLVEVDYEVDMPDPSRPDTGLLTAAGDYVRYRGRVDLLAVDEHDAYWVLRHRVVEDWTDFEALLRDEEAVAACWAWEHFYIGMQIAGTIHNELRLPGGTEADGAGPRPRTTPHPSSRHERGGVPQHEGSGGGRSIPQHRRLYAQANEPDEPERTVRDDGPWFRRTWIRRSRAEIEQAGRQLAGEALEILGGSVAVFPSPSEPTCGPCPFRAPCLAMYEGGDAEAILAADYRPRAPGELVEGRLGGVSWSTGRGAAPPRFFAWRQPGRPGHHGALSRRTQGLVTRVCSLSKAAPPAWSFVPGA